jgi:hypothetical protein
MMMMMRRRRRRRRWLFIVILDTNIMFLDIIHHPASVSKHCLVYISKYVLETGFYLCLQVKLTQLGCRYRCLEIGTSSVD